MNKISCREMTISDYARILTLWQKTPGLGLSDADSREGIRAFLEWNPGLCFVCEEGERLIGTILCGHDGRRGYIYHLAVDEAYRKRGIGRQLTQKSLDALHLRGITKCHLFVYRDNEEAEMFYDSLGWQKRTMLDIFSKDI
ncbi:MAG: GNAT family N-acetyltransferase [Bacteroidota bacterium]|jgi:ribosomal protein S18 acetylase RimI-like enzyme